MWTIIETDILVYVAELNLLGRVWHCCCRGREGANDIDGLDV